MALIKQLSELVGLLDGRLTLLKDAILEMEEKPGYILISWLGRWSKYLKAENTFDCSHMKSYSRGEIIRVDLGFRGRNEEGGEHYAVVMDVSNNPKNPTLMALPLSSLKPGKSVNRNDVDLGPKLIKDINPVNGENLAKEGTSIALISQLTCISKQKILRPCNTSEAVLGKVSPAQMRVIERKIAKRFLKSVAEDANI